LAVVKIDVSDQLISFIIRVERISEIGTTLAVAEAAFLRNIGFYKSHTASHPRRRQYS
jgi:hypothetical protein